jgi:hypothetical protein
MLCLCSSGRDRGDLRFEFETLRLHVSTYLHALRSFPPTSSWRSRVTLTDFTGEDRASRLQNAVLEPLRRAFPDMEFGFDPGRQRGRTYYQGLGFELHGVTEQGAALFLADGGVTDWTAQLMGDVKERTVVSGISGERIAAA